MPELVDKYGEVVRRLQYPPDPEELAEASEEARRIGGRIVKQQDYKEGGSIFSIGGMSDELESWPDEVLLEEYQNQTKGVPQYLLISELGRRKDLREGAQAQGELPQQTVADEIIASTQGGGIGSMPQMQPQMQPPMQPQMPPQGGIRGLVHGGPISEHNRIDAANAREEEVPVGIESGIPTNETDESEDTWKINPETGDIDWGDVAYDVFMPQTPLEYAATAAMAIPVAGWGYGVARAGGRALGKLPTAYRTYKKWRDIQKANALRGTGRGIERLLRREPPVGRKWPWGPGLTADRTRQLETLGGKVLNKRNIGGVAGVGLYAGSKLFSDEDDSVDDAGNPMPQKHEETEQEKADRLAREAATLGGISGATGTAGTAGTAGAVDEDDMSLDSLMRRALDVDYGTEDYIKMLTDLESKQTNARGMGLLQMGAALASDTGSFAGALARSANKGAEAYTRIQNENIDDRIKYLALSVGAKQAEAKRLVELAGLAATVSASRATQRIASGARNNRYWRDRKDYFKKNIEAKQEKLQNGKLPSEWLEDPELGPYYYIDKKTGRTVFNKEKLNELAEDYADQEVSAYPGVAI